jgi:NAD(P)-dependent dehydrogenase (short-subunit alcohol dehydrogenase family)
MDKFSLNGKTILVTGASSGIGRGIAIACAEQGACVVLTGRNGSRLKETLSLMSGEGHIIIPADLTDEKKRQELVERVPELDGLVQCAGVMNRVPCKSIGQEDIDSVFAPNVEAPMLLQAELLQERKIKKGTSIVYMASIAARSAVAGNALYSASKAAIIAYAKCLSLELAPRQIRVNCICPAMVWTDLALVGATREELEQDQLKYPLKRYGQPEDIAGLAIYLLSDVSGWMTGSCVEITGGGNELKMN